MKCSLLTLSTFIDDEMPAEHRADVEAHLVGCPRCGAGVATLREEKLRVSRLARVRVPPPSATALLESVGVSGAAVQARAPRSVRESGGGSPNRPWLEGRSSAALPWTPLRPQNPPHATEETAVPAVPPDQQPDLPFDRVGVAGHTGESVVPTGAGTLEWEADEAHVGDEPAAADHLPVLEGWELRVPGYAGETGGSLPPRSVAAPPEPAPRGSAPAPGGDTEPPAGRPPIAPRSGEPSSVLMSPAPVADPVAAGPPRRAEALGGPRGVWNRVRDVVGVRLALAGSGAGEDSLDFATGPAPPHRSLPPPIAGFESPTTTTPRVRSQPTVAPAAPVAAPAGTTAGRPQDRGRPAAPPAGRPGAHPPRVPVDPSNAAAPLDGDWNAFGASAYRDTVPAAAVEPAARHTQQRAPVGRHARALRRETGGTALRIRRGTAGVAAVLQRRGAALGTHARQATGALPALSPRRLAMVGAGLVALIVIVVLLGHSSSPSRPGTASVSSPTSPPRASTAPTTTAAPATAAPATVGPTSAPAPSAPPALASPLRLGTGGTGFQVTRLRYGVFNGAQRIVFDLDATTTAASGSPAVVVGSADPSTVLVTFTGAVSAGSISSPPGGMIQTVALVSSSSSRTVFRITLSHAATASAFYLSGPLRLVLDVR